MDAELVSRLAYDQALAHAADMRLMLFAVTGALSAVIAYLAKLQFSVLWKRGDEMRDLTERVAKLAEETTHVIKACRLGGRPDEG